MKDVHSLVQAQEEADRTSEQELNRTSKVDPEHMPLAAMSLLQLGMCSCCSLRIAELLRTSQATDGCVGFFERKYSEYTGSTTDN